MDDRRPRCRRRTAANVISTSVASARVLAQVPGVHEPPRRLPRQHAPPVVLLAARRPLVDPPALARLERHRLGLARDGVRGRPPQRRALGPDRERVLRRAADRELVDERLAHSGVLGRQPETRRGLAPDLLEVRAHRLDALVVQLVDPPRALGAVVTSPASLSSRRWRETAGRLIGSASAISLTERPPLAQQLDDRAPVRVAERLERVHALDGNRRATVTAALRVKFYEADSR